MRAAALFASMAFTLLGGCILVYNPENFEIGGGASAGAGGKGVGGAGGGTGGDGVGGSSGGAGGSAVAWTCSPDPVDLVGTALTGLNDNEWNWVDVVGSKCRNGSQTGFAVRPRTGAKKLVIFFDGEGSCFSAASCSDPDASLPYYGLTEFTQKSAQFGDIGIFNMVNDMNPVKDWHVVAIPYCTGDFHVGTSANADVPGGPTNQQFVGYTNVGLYMQRILATFKNLDEVLVTGISSGGFGALYNFDRIARDFCPTPVVLINDSGPPLPPPYYAPCLQEHMGPLWGLASAPPDCDGVGFSVTKLLQCLRTKYDRGRFGMIVSKQDTKAMDFYGLGQDNCKNLLSGTPTSMLPATFQQGLQELTKNFMPNPPWSAYFDSANGHVYIIPAFYSTTVQGVSLTTWVSDMVDLNKPVPGHLP